MPETTRCFSTGHWTSELFEQELTQMDERTLYCYLRTNLSTTSCGFYHFSIATASAQTLIPFQRASEIIAKLHALGAIVYERGYVFIPNFIEEQNLASWYGTPDHVRKQRNRFLASGGKEDNLAFRAFSERFNEILSAPAQPRKSRKKGSDPEGTAQGGEPTLSAEKSGARDGEPRGNTPAYSGPPKPAIHKVQPPTIEEVQAAFRSWKLKGTNLSMPNAEITAGEFFEWYEERGWPDDWQKKITVWGTKRLKEREDREEDLDEGPRLPSGRRLAL